MPTPIVKVLFVDNEHWVVVYTGGQVAYASRDAAVSAAVYKAIEESACLMIYEHRAAASAPKHTDDRDLRIEK